MARLKPIEEAPQKASLRCVTQWIAIGVGPDVKSKADSGRGPAPLLDTDAAQLRALDPPELAARDTYGGPGGVLADAVAVGRGVHVP